MQIQQDNAAEKKINDRAQFRQKKNGEVLKRSANSFDLNPMKKIENSKQQLRNKTVLWDILE